MRPTFMGFETAKSGLNVSQKALDITGNNLANADTAGYTRQRLDVNSIAPSSYSTRIAVNRIGLTGQGVEGLGVGQTRDAFLDKRFRDEYSSASYYSQANAILNDIQSALGDASDVSEGGDVFAQAIRQIYESLNDFSGNPTSTPHANLVLSAFNNATQVLQLLDKKLNDVADQQIFDLGVGVDRVNSILEQIAHLNKSISNDATVLQNPDNEYFRPNELMDHRNLLLDELASYGNINVTLNGDATVTVKMGNHEVVSGETFDKINMSTDEELGIVSLTWNAIGDSVQLTGGALLGYTDFINGRGTNMQNPGETNKQGILYYKDRLNTMARTMANLVNSVIPEMEETPDPNNPDGPPILTQKVDGNGNLVFKELISAKTADGTTDNKIPVTAANISVSDLWTQGGADYFISASGDKNNANYAQQISNLLTGQAVEFVSYGETFTGTFEEYLIDYTGKIGADASFYENRQNVVAKVADEYLNKRDEISGVSENEETVNMMTYQKSFNASSRLMTTLDDLLDTLINSTGRVGL
ncbi:MAG: flagellar hook-associated protein FlgK [Clostridiales bacterium]|nr:flagellar hook-associated protein FlgK [Clostridiales bacterium]